VGLLGKILERLAIEAKFYQLRQQSVDGLHCARSTCFKSPSQEEIMRRDRVFKVVLALVGTLFLAAIYPAVGGVRHPEGSDTGDTMMMSLYATLGVFLFLAIRDPSAHRSVIAFAAWSSFAHAAVMSLLAITLASERVGYLIGSTVLVIIGIALVVLAPPKSVQRTAPLAT
jgi:hypothetical protein